MMFLTQSEFAKQQGWQRSYVTQLKAAGRLVMADGKVDVARSLDLIARTADPNRDDVATRHARNRAAKAKTDGAVSADTSGAEKTAPAPEYAPAGGESGAEKAAASYSKSRAVKEHYAALRAKAEYERDVLGKLCETDSVTRAGAGLGALLRTKLEGSSDRLAPVLAPISSVEETHAMLVAHHEAILNEIADELEKLARAVTRGAA